MRTIAQDGTVRLIVQFTNGNHDPIDPDGAVTVSIFDPDYPPFDVDVTDLDATVLDATPTKVAGETGLYYYEYTLAPDAKTGSWYDRWEGVVDGVAQEAVLSFSVSEKAIIDSVTLEQNQVIVVKLDHSITNTSGTELSDDVQIFFSTVLNPMYASADLVGLEIGVYIPNIPEFTLDLAIHWASIETDAQTFTRRSYTLHPQTHAPMRGGGVNREWLDFVRTEYTLCRAAARLMGNAIAYPMKSKTLADLSVSYDTGKFSSRMGELNDRCRELRRILNSGGKLSEGASLPMTSTIKGIYDHNRPMFGRDWERYQNTRGGSNAKSYTSSGTRAKHHWSQDPVLLKPWWGQ